MDVEDLERIVRSFLEECNKHGDKTADLYVWKAKHATFFNLLSNAARLFPDHNGFFVKILDDIENYDIYDTIDALKHILEIMEIEKSSEAKIKKMKIFDSVEDKMKQAGLSFRKDDYSSVFHNLNTALELVLKGKLGIPTTITKIDTSNIIDILAKHKVEPHLYLAEVKKRILTIDNKIKHQGYSPSKIDRINGIKVMEELISRLRDKEIELTEDVRNKIYQGL